MEWSWRIIMAATQRRYSKEELARRGDANYEQEVRPQLKADDQGKFAALDTASTRGSSSDPRPRYRRGP
jgi:23S rRNA maturation mini-RNase III